MVIVTTYERREAARLSIWIKKSWDTDQCMIWMFILVLDELHPYVNMDKFKARSKQAKTARGYLKGGSFYSRGVNITTLKYPLEVRENPWVMIGCT